jgi:hypothetical protein
LRGTAKRKIHRRKITQDAGRRSCVGELEMAALQLPALLLLLLLPALLLAAAISPHLVGDVVFVGRVQKAVDGTVMFDMNGVQIKTTVTGTASLFVSLSQVHKVEGNVFQVYLDGVLQPDSRFNTSSWAAGQVVKVPLFPAAALDTAIPPRPTQSPSSRIPSRHLPPQTSRCQTTSPSMGSVATQPLVCSLRSNRPRSSSTRWSSWEIALQRDSTISATSKAPPKECPGQKALRSPGRL